MTKMFSQTDYEQIARAQVFTSDRQGLGRVDQLYVSDDTNTPTWVTINTGLFGMRTHFVPLTDAQIDGDRLYLPYTKDQDHRRALDRRERPADSRGGGRALPPLRPRRR